VLALAVGADQETAAIAVSVAAGCYLGAAAMGRRWVGWVGIPAGTGAVVLGEVIGLPWWAALGLVAAAAAGIGVAAGLAHGHVTAEALAMLAFGGCAVAAVVVSGRVGLVLAGSALAVHAVWDVVHYRRDAVVPRSLAEACIAIDLPVGLGVVASAFL
jgi:hypothetical protein